MDKLIEEEQTYVIEISETLTRGVEVKAQSPDLALIQIKQSYTNEDIVLDSTYYISTEFLVKPNDNANT